MAAEFALLSGVVRSRDECEKPRVRITVHHEIPHSTIVRRLLEYCRRKQERTARISSSAKGAAAKGVAAKAAAAAKMGGAAAKFAAQGVGVKGFAAGSTLVAFAVRVCRSDASPTPN